MSQRCVWHQGITYKGIRNQGIRRPRCTRGFKGLKNLWLIYYNTQNLELDYVSSDKTVDSQEDFTYKIVVNSNMNLLVLVELILKFCSWMASIPP
jgi:hypothetical protein